MRVRASFLINKIFFIYSKPCGFSLYNSRIAFEEGFAFDLLRQIWSSSFLLKKQVKPDLISLFSQGLNP